METPTRDALFAGTEFCKLRYDVISGCGLQAAVMYAELTRESECLERTGKTNDGWFYSFVEYVMNRVGLSEYQQRNAVKTLTRAGLIEYRTAGQNARRYFRIVKPPPSAQTDATQDAQPTVNTANNSTNGEVYLSNNCTSKDVTCLKIRQVHGEKLSTNKRVNNKSIDREAAKPPSLEQIEEYAKRKREEGKNVPDDMPVRFCSYYDKYKWTLMGGRSLIPKWREKFDDWIEKERTPAAAAGTMGENGIRVADAPADDLDELFGGDRDGVDSIS